MQESTVSSILQECKETLAAYYAERLQGVVLYGSMARGDAGPASDIDLLVLLSSPFDFFVELRQIVELLYPIQLESEWLISARPALASDYDAGSISLYRNARRNGLVSRRDQDRSLFVPLAFMGRSLAPVCQPGQ